MPRETYIQVVLREFRGQRQLADRAMSQVTDEQFFARLDRGDNSIAIIVKHMAGNMRSRWRDFLTSDGEKPDRNRDTEFVLNEEDTRQALRRLWDTGWGLLFDALEPLDDSDLGRTVTIRGEELTVLQAINRQLTHYAYHVGQLALLAKHFAAGQWQTLSIPKGESSAFNVKPTRYLEESDA